MALPSASTSWSTDLTAVLSDVRLCVHFCDMPTSPGMSVDQGTPDVSG
jgi:hypothetical protein